MVLSDFVTFGYGFGAGCGIGIGNGFFKGTEILGLSAGIGCGIGLGFGWGFGKARARQVIDDNLVIDDSQGIKFENKLTEETDMQKSLESTQKIHSSE